MEKISGVYKVTNKITGDFYIGSSKNIKQRWAAEKSPSTWATFPGMKLYQAIISYGLENFEFEIIEETDKLKEREQYWIEQLSPTYNNRRAKDLDISRNKKTVEDWQKTNRNRYMSNYKEYCNKLCLYEGKVITFKALTMRFIRHHIPHPNKEAKKYLIAN